MAAAGARARPALARAVAGSIAGPSRIRNVSYFPPPEPFTSPNVAEQRTVRRSDSLPGMPDARRGDTSSEDADLEQTATRDMPSRVAPSPVSLLSTFGAPPALLSTYLAVPPTSLTLSSLLHLGGSPGVPPSEAQLLHSGRFTAKELPIRLARRVDQFRSLPFIVGSNPYIAKVAKLYASSFERLVSVGEIKTLADNSRFVEKLEEIVDLHKENVPTLARGFLECKKYMTSTAISTFLNGAIHSRIGIRLIAEQHLALSLAHETGQTATPHSVGVIDTRVNAYDLIKADSDFVGQLCESTLGEKPDIHIEGSREASFVGVASHLSYCMTELLKNSYRATVERHLTAIKRGDKRKGAEIPPITLSIAKSRSHLSIRIRDQGGGIAPKNLPHIFNYTFTTAPGSEGNTDDGGPYAAQNIPGGADDAFGAITGMAGASAGEAGGAPGVGLTSPLGTLAGLGYGLPMSRIYTEHGRGSLDIVSLYGHGCDTFIKVRANPLEN